MRVEGFNFLGKIRRIVRTSQRATRKLLMERGLVFNRGVANVFEKWRRGGLTKKKGGKKIEGRGYILKETIEGLPKFWLVGGGNSPQSHY